MTDKVESDPPEEQAQETAPTSTDKDVKPSSQPQDGFVTRAEFESLQKQLRGLQGAGDKTASAVEKALEQIGTLKLSPEEQAEVVDKLRPEPKAEPESLEEKTPVVEPQLDEIVQKVVAKLQDLPSGASVATPGGATLPPSQPSISEAKDELAAIQQAKPRSQRTRDEQERVDELIEIIEQEDQL